MKKIFLSLFVIFLLFFNKYSVYCQSPIGNNLSISGEQVYTYEHNESANIPLPRNSYYNFNNIASDYVLNRVEISGSLNEYFDQARVEIRAGKINIRLGKPKKMWQPFTNVKGITVTPKNTNLLAIDDFSNDDNGHILDITTIDTQTWYSGGALLFYVDRDVIISGESFGDYIKQIWQNVKLTEGWNYVGFSLEWDEKLDATVYTYKAVKQSEIKWVYYYQLMGPGE
jgi:hypothetical protein